MITNPYKAASRYLGDDEELRWAGVPVSDPEQRALRPILWLLRILIAIGLVYIAVQIGYAAVVEARPDGAFRMDLLHIALRPHHRDLLLVGGACLTFGLFMVLLRNHYREAHNVVYAISDQRVFIADGGRVEKQWGPGDLAEPTVKPHREYKGIGDVFFVEVEDQLGGGRKHRVPYGFESVSNPTEVAAEITTLLAELASEREIDNPHHGFRLTVPGDWTAFGFALDRDADRDATPGAVLGAVLEGRIKPLTVARIAGDWSVLVLSQRVDKRKLSDDRLDRLLIVVEADLSPLQPIAGVITWDDQRDGSIADYLGMSNTLEQTLRERINVVNFAQPAMRDKGQRQWFSVLAPDHKSMAVKGAGKAWQKDSTVAVGKVNCMIRQVYRYLPTRVGRREFLLHLRMTYIAPEDKEAKTFKKYLGVLTALVNSVEAAGAAPRHAEETREIRSHRDEETDS